MEPFSRDALDRILFACFGATCPTWRLHRAQTANLLGDRRGVEFVRPFDPWRCVPPALVRVARRSGSGLYLGLLFLFQRLHVSGGFPA